MKKHDDEIQDKAHLIRGQESPAAGVEDKQSPQGKSLKDPAEVVEAQVTAQLEPVSQRAREVENELKRAQLPEPVIKAASEAIGRIEKAVQEARKKVDNELELDKLQGAARLAVAAVKNHAARQPSGREHKQVAQEIKSLGLEQEDQLVSLVSRQYRQE